MATIALRTYQDPLARRSMYYATPPLLMSDIVVKKALFTEFYESTKLLVKETRKVKDLRDQCIDLEGQFKRILSE